MKLIADGVNQRDDVVVVLDHRDVARGGGSSVMALLEGLRHGR